MNDGDQPLEGRPRETEIIEQLAALSAPVARMLTEHQENNFGEILPTLFFEEIARWFAAGHATSTTDPASYAEAKLVVNRIGELYADAPDDVANTIAVGFVEATIPPDWSLPEYVDDLPESLRHELATMLNWRPGS